MRLTRMAIATRLARTLAITAAWATCGVESVRADTDPQDAVRLDVSYHLARHGTQLGLVLGTAHFELPHNDYLGDPFYEVTTGVGWVSGVRTVHSVAARVGTSGLGYLEEFVFGTCGGSCSRQLMGISTGVALDGAGERIPEAWTIPIDGYVYARIGDSMSLGPIGGASWAFAGADRGIGWRAGLDLIVAGVGSGRSLRCPRNVHVSAQVQRLAGSSFLGITVGIEDGNRYEPFLTSAQ